MVEDRKDEEFFASEKPCFSGGSNQDLNLPLIKKARQTRLIVSEVLQSKLNGDFTLVKDLSHPFWQEEWIKLSDFLFCLKELEKKGITGEYIWGEIQGLRVKSWESKTRYILNKKDFKSKELYIRLSDVEKIMGVNKK